MEVEELKPENDTQDIEPTMEPPSRVLVVDDDTRLREGLIIILRKEGYQTVEAHNGFEAIKMTSNINPDLILLDMMMPKLNGIEVCRQLKNDESTRLIPIIMITAVHEQSEKLRAIEAGTDDFLNKPVNLPELRVRVKSLLRMKHLNDLLHRSDTVISSLANAIEAKDEYTEGHNERVSNYAVQLARAAGLSEKEQEIIKMAGILHDIGKIGIPDSILNKKSGLDNIEFENILTHPKKGEKILKPLHSLREVRDVVLYHHERYDGRGYPNGLKGSEIPLFARILSIADSYDAMTTTRSYRKALSKQEATTELKKHAGRMWDAKLVEIFIEHTLNSNVMKND